MRARTICAALLLAGLTPAGAHAAGPDGNFAVKGAGLETCKTYLTARDEQAAEYLVFRTWLNAFITAYNMQTPETHDVAPMHTIGQLAAALARVCQETPEEPVVNAAVGVVNGLAPARTTRPSETVETRANGTTVSLPANLLARVQRALKAEGLYTGPIDAKYGPGTASALEAFQEQAGLEVTTLPDRATVLRLMRQQDGG